MFPTRYRERLPESLSYPVGAKRISETLNGVPQALEIAFRISWKLRETWEKEKSYPVLEIQYMRDYRDRLPFPEWQIYVHPVPRNLKHRISKLLISEGLPRIRSWLMSPSRPKSNEGAERLVIWYDPHQDSFQYQHTSHIQPERTTDKFGSR